jgi:hypothetical protein
MVLMKSTRQRRLGTYMHVCIQIHTYTHTHTHTYTHTHIHTHTSIQVLIDGFDEVDAAEETLIKVLEMAPNNATALHTYGVLIWRTR